MLNLDLLKRIRNASDAELAEVALRLLVDNPQLFITLFATDVQKPYSVYRDNDPDGCRGSFLTTLHLTDQDVDRIKAAGYRSGKISAIKVAREITQTGLLEAKRLVEINNWYAP